jgi:hypothetical protein
LDTAANVGELLAADELVEEKPIGPDGLDGGPTERHRYQAEG